MIHNGPWHDAVHGGSFQGAWGWLWIEKQRVGLGKDGDGGCWWACFLQESTCGAWPVAWAGCRLKQGRLKVPSMTWAWAPEVARSGHAIRRCSKG